MKIKVCGMTNAEANSQLLQYEPIDFLGSIQFPPSARYFPSKLATSRPTTGVFVNETAANILSKVDAFALSGVQLHGNETIELIEQLPKELLIIKAFSISKKEDLLQTTTFEGKVDYFLFDTSTPQHGGSGQQFDWSILQHYQGSTPFFLSGGIGPEDVCKIQAFSHPLFAGIDINSCFENQPGQKNAQAVIHFIQQLNA